MQCVKCSADKAPTEFYAGRVVCKECVCAQARADRADRPERQRPTVERLRELLAYDPETGDITWRVKHGRVAAGAIVRAKDEHGYIKVGIDGGSYGTHRVAWAIATGAWPEENIDHINGQTGDNRFANMRDVPHAINMENRRRPERGNKTNTLGVVFDAKRGKFRAKVTTEGKSVHAGRHETAEAAHAAYLEKKRSLHRGCTI